MVSDGRFTLPPMTALVLLIKIGAAKRRGRQVPDIYSRATTGHDRHGEEQKEKKTCKDGALSHANLTRRFRQTDEKILTKMANTTTAHRHPQRFAFPFSFRSRGIRL